MASDGNNTIIEKQQDMADTTKKEETKDLVEQIENLDISEKNSSLSPRPSMKPSDDTHNNIFGDRPADKKAGRVYHMSSDIFGVGSIIDRDGQHTGCGNRVVKKNDNDDVETEKIQEPETTSEIVNVAASKNNDETDEKVNESSSPVLDSSVHEKKSSGKNPINGDGPNAETQRKHVKSQRRHYPDSQRSESLW